MQPEQLVHPSTDLLAFTEWSFREIKKQAFRRNWHHVKIAQKLEDVVLGKTKRLIINMPPRYTKTEMSVVNFIPWALQLAPDAEFIHTSYSKTLAANNTANAKDIVLHEKYLETFPNVTVKVDSKSKADWRTTKGGVVYAAGAGGTITGFGAGKNRDGFGGCIIIDDPHKPDEADSEVIRKGVIDWFGNTIESRVNSPDTPIIVIMQRLHQEDLSGWLLDGGNGEQWEHLCLPVEMQGKPIWPWKHSAQKLEQMRTKNPYVFAGQYMQNPVPLEGGLVRKDWINTYLVKPKEFLRIVQSWDTAYKDKQHNDPSVCTTWMQTRKGYHLLDVFVKRMRYPEVKQKAKELAARWQPDAVLIEDKGSGQSLIQELRDETHITVISIEPTADKVTRLMAVTSEYESGRVFHPEKADWLDAYESEMYLFPNSKHDDQVDSTSQAIRWMHQTATSVEFASAGRREIAQTGIKDDSGYGRIRSHSNTRGY